MEAPMMCLGRLLTFDTNLYRSVQLCLSLSFHTDIPNLENDRSEKFVVSDIVCGRAAIQLAFL